MEAVIVVNKRMVIDMVKVQKFSRMGKNIPAIGIMVSEQGKVFILGPAELSMLVSSFDPHYDFVTFYICNE